MRWFLCINLFLSTCLFLFCSGVGGSGLKERPRALPGTGQSSGGRATFDLLQSCGPGERVVLPQCAAGYLIGTGCAEGLTLS